MAGHSLAIAVKPKFRVGNQLFSAVTELNCTKDRSKWVSGELNLLCQPHLSKGHHRTRFPSLTAIRSNPNHFVAKIEFQSAYSCAILNKNWVMSELPVIRPEPRKQIVEMEFCGLASVLLWNNALDTKWDLRHPVCMQ